MSQSRNSRNCSNNEQWTQEPNRNYNDLSQIIEEQSDDERYKRYDPKELRDAARILSPFLKLTDEVNNPYARLVARELCDTFYSTFYPNQDPLDVKKCFKSLLTGQKSMQIWNEIGLYSPGPKCKEWVPLCKEPVVEINEICDPCRPQDNDDFGPSDQQQCPEICDPCRTQDNNDFGPSDQQQCPDSENFNRRLSQSNNRDRSLTPNCDINKTPIPTTRQSPEYKSFDDTCDLDSSDIFYDVKSSDMFDNSYQNLSDISPPESNFYDSYQDLSGISPLNNTFDASNQNLCDLSPPNNMSDNAYENFNAVSPPLMFDNSYQQLSDISPPDMYYNSYEDVCDEHHTMYSDQQLSAGSDSLPVTQKSKPNVRNTMSHRISIRNQKNYSRLYSEDIQDKSDDFECNERLRVNTYLDAMSEETIDKYETDNIAVQQVSSHRQHAGNDLYLPYCEPGCSTDRGFILYDNPEDPSQFEYYRIIGNSPSPARNTNRPNVQQTSLITPEHRTNAVDENVNNNECDCSSSDESQVSVAQIGCNAEIVANAFTTVSLAQQEVERKRNAFGALTKNCLNRVSKPAKKDCPATGSRRSKKMLRTIYKSPPSTLMPFDNSEWNDNCFRDKDFVRLLPFYEIVHNQLEYIAETQREYGFNILDDVMSVFYHIHYDLGDPRLKNDMLIEHVKLVTKNTWESFFYPANQTMPAIPEKPDRYYTPSPQRQSMSRCPSPMQVNSRQASPRPPNQMPLAPRQNSSSPQQRCMSQHLSPTQENPRQGCSISPNQVPLAPRQICQNPPRKEQRPIPSTNATRQPRTESCNRAPNVQRPTRNPPVTEQKSRPCSSANRRPPADEPQKTDNPPVAAQKNYLRRSQPSGAPKAWVPKMKAVERPKEMRTFKAKPVPKFVRDRIESQYENC